MSDAAQRLARQILAPRSSTPVRYGTVVSTDPANGLLVLRPSTASLTDGTQDVAARYLTPVPPAVNSVVRFDVVQGDVLVLGSPTLDAYAALPFATAAGNVGVAVSASPTGSQAVSFPSGRFLVAPIVVVSVRDGTNVWVATASGISVTGFTANVRHVDNVNATGTVNVQWHAIQMTSTTAAG